MKTTLFWWAVVVGAVFSLAIAASVADAGCKPPQVVRGHHVVAVVDHHHVQAVAVPQVYYQVGSGLREEAIAERAAEKTIAKLQTKLDELEKRLATANKVSGKGTFVFSADGEGDVNPGPDPAPPSGDVDGPKQIPASIPAMKALCASCHSGASAKAGLDLAKPVTWAQASEILRRTHTDDASIRMPPSGRISDAQRQEIFVWSVTR